MSHRITLLHPETGEKTTASIDGAIVLIDQGYVEADEVCDYVPEADAPEAPEADAPEGDAPEADSPEGE